MDAPLSEPQDVIIDEKWFWSSKIGAQSSGTDVKVAIADKTLPYELSLIDRIFQYFENRKLKKRVTEFAKHEKRDFVSNLQKKFEKILADLETHDLLVNQLIGNDQTSLKLMETAKVREICKTTLRSFEEYNQDSLTSGPLFDSLMEYDRLISTDPLCNWSHNGVHENSFVLGRFQEFAAQMSSMVKYSLLVEPGRMRSQISSFITEFRELDNFFDSVKLDTEERAQSAFDSNYLLKPRNSKLECVDISRVVLRLPEKLTNTTNDVDTKQPNDIFGDIDCPRRKKHKTYGTGDFIHANYVCGGSLWNKFICTQAPMKNTMSDFWRMIWQESPSYIFMLCDAVETKNLGPFGTDDRDFCPYYWPKVEGEQCQFGSLVVRNECIDNLADPLFTVTTLIIHHIEKPEFTLRVEHWQWDWRDYRDIHWPLRLLRRSRQSTRPTVVHCLDGCGRTGAFVLIEIMLMHLFRGTTTYDHPVLTCAVFLRLQRHHAVANYLQYIYVYRVLLHVAHPFVESTFDRYSLGLIFGNNGFIARFNELAHDWARKMLLK